MASSASQKRLIKPPSDDIYIRQLQKKKKKTPLSATTATATAQNAILQDAALTGQASTSADPAPMEVIIHQPTSKKNSNKKRSLALEDILDMADTTSQSTEQAEPQHKLPEVPSSSAPTAASSQDNVTNLLRDVSHEIPSLNHRPGVNSPSTVIIQKMKPASVSPPAVAISPEMAKIIAGIVASENRKFVKEMGETLAKHMMMQLRHDGFYKEAVNISKNMKVLGNKVAK
jgi:hypothetical protein